MGKPYMRDVWGNHLKDQLSQLVHWLSMTYFCERPVKNPSIWKESLTWIVPRICIIRGGNLEGWRTGCRPWGVGDDGLIWNLLEKTQCKRIDISQRKWKNYFPVADGRIKLPGGDQDLRTSTLIRHRPIRGESHVDFLGESEGSLPPPHDSFPDAGEEINDFWSMSGNFIYRHHVEPRVELSRREKNHSLFRWNTLTFPELLIRIWMSSKSVASMTIGISMGQETCLIIGQVSLSLFYWKKNLQTDICGPGRDWQESS